MIIQQSSSKRLTAKRKRAVLVGIVSSLLVSSNLAYAAGLGETQPIPIGQVSVSRVPHMNPRVSRSEFAARNSAAELSRQVATFNLGAYRSRADLRAERPAILPSAGTASSLDLRSMVANINLGQSILKGANSIVIKVGAGSKEIAAGSFVTPGELVAIGQCLAGTQTIILRSNGSVAGGSISLDLLNPILTDLKIADLVIPRHVTAIDDVSIGPSLQLSGNLINYGSIYTITSSMPDAVSQANIFALNINNQRGGLISSELPQNSLPGLGGFGSVAGLNLFAQENINNQGQILSAGVLNLSAGKSIINALPNGVAGPGPIIRAVDSVNLDIGNGRLVNEGLIVSVTNNITVASKLPETNINISGTGGTFQAQSGDINVRDASYAGSSNINIGGNYLSRNLNLYSGSGEIEGHLGQVLGRLNTQAGVEHIAARTNRLSLGSNCVTGDPTFSNVGGSISIDGDISVGEDLTIIASQDITNTGTPTVSAGNSKQGFNITLIAGANLTAGGTGTSTSTAPSTASTIVASVVTNPHGASSSGGNITLSGVTISSQPISATDAANGGNVLLAAYANPETSANGVINLTGSSINASGAGSGTNGSVSMIAGYRRDNSTSVFTGAVTSNGGTGGGGAITIQTAQPTIGAPFGAATYDINGSLSSGSAPFAGERATGNVDVNGNITSASTIVINTWSGSIMIDATTPGTLTAPSVILSSVGANISASTASANLSVNTAGNVNINDGSASISLNPSSGNNFMLNGSGSIITKGNTTVTGLLSLSTSSLNIGTGDTLQGRAVQVLGIPGAELTVAVASGAKILATNSALSITGSTGNNVVINNAGTLEAGNGASINIKSTPDAITQAGGNLSVGGGGSMQVASGTEAVINLAANTSPDIYCANNVEFNGSQTFIGNTNIWAAGQNQQIILDNGITVTQNQPDTLTFYFGSNVNNMGATITGNASYFTSAGSIVNTAGSINLNALGTSIKYVGESLAILASGSISDNGVSTQIQLESPAGDGGNLTLVAGYDITPSVTPQQGPILGQFTVSVPNLTGGSINLANTTITTSGTSNGGNVLVIDNGGSIVLGDITSSGGNGTGGNVTVIGTGDVEVGTINTQTISGSRGGNVTIASAAPSINGTLIICNGLPLDSVSVGAASTAGQLQITGTLNTGAGGTVTLTSGTNIGSPGAYVQTSSSGLNISSAGSAYVNNIGALNYSANVGGDAYLTNAGDVTMSNASSAGSANTFSIISNPGATGYGSIAGNAAAISAGTVTLFAPNGGISAKTATANLNVSSLWGLGVNNVGTVNYTAKSELGGADLSNVGSVTIANASSAGIQPNCNFGITVHPDPVSGDGHITIAAPVTAGGMIALYSGESDVTGGTNIGGISDPGGFTLSANAIWLSDQFQGSSYIPFPNGRDIGSSGAYIQTATSSLHVSTAGSSYVNNVGAVTYSMSAGGDSYLTNAGPVTGNSWGGGHTLSIITTPDASSGDGFIAIGFMNLYTFGTTTITLRSSESDILGGTNIGGISNTAGYTLTAETINLVDTFISSAGSGVPSTQDIGGSGAYVQTFTGHLNVSTGGSSYINNTNNWPELSYGANTGKDAYLLNAGNVSIAQPSSAGSTSTFSITTSPVYTGEGYISINAAVTAGGATGSGTIALQSSESDIWDGTIGGIRDDSGYMLTAGTVRLSDTLISSGGSGTPSNRDIGSPVSYIPVNATTLSANTTGNVYINAASSAAIGLDGSSGNNFTLVSGGNIVTNGNTTVTGLLTLNTNSLNVGTGDTLQGRSVQVLAIPGADLTLAVQSGGKILATNSALDITGDTGRNVIINNAGTLEADNGASINITSTPDPITYAGGNLSVGGGGSMQVSSGTAAIVNLRASTSPDIQSANNVEFIGSQTFSGNTNVSAAGPNQQIILDQGITIIQNQPDTLTFYFGRNVSNMGATVTGNVNYFTSAGSIINTAGSVNLNEFGTTIKFVGESLAILASGSILDNGVDIQIQLDNASGDGGNLTLIAGYDFTPSVTPQQGPIPGAFTVSGPNLTGGSIGLGNTTITTTGSRNGGNVLAIDNGGSIILGNITSSGGNGTGGNVMVIGTGDVEVGTINTQPTNGSSGGNVTIASATPNLSVPLIIYDGFLYGSVSVGTSSTSGQLEITGPLNAGAGSTITLASGTNIGSPGAYIQTCTPQLKISTAGSSYVNNIGALNYTANVGGDAYLTNAGSVTITNTSSAGPANTFSVITSPDATTGDGFIAVNAAVSAGSATGSGVIRLNSSESGDLTSNAGGIAGSSMLTAGSIFLTDSFAGGTGGAIPVQNIGSTQSATANLIVSTNGSFFGNNVGAVNYSTHVGGDATLYNAGPVLIQEAVIGPSNTFGVSTSPDASTGDGYIAINNNIDAGSTGNINISSSASDLTGGTNKGGISGAFSLTAYRIRLSAGFTQSGGSGSFTADIGSPSAYIQTNTSNLLIQATENSYVHNTGAVYYSVLAGGDAYFSNVGSVSYHAEAGRDAYLSNIGSVKLLGGRSNNTFSVVTSPDASSGDGYIIVSGTMQQGGHIFARTINLNSSESNVTGGTNAGGIFKDIHFPYATFFAENVNLTDTFIPSSGGSGFAPSAVISSEGDIGSSSQHLVIDAPSLTVSAGGRAFVDDVQSVTLDSSQAFDLYITAPGITVPAGVSIAGTNSIVLKSSGDNTLAINGASSLNAPIIDLEVAKGLLSLPSGITAAIDGAGNAGSIIANFQTVAMPVTFNVSAGSTGGNAGTVTLQTSGALSIAPTHILVNASGPSAGKGNAGMLSATADTINFDAAGVMLSPGATGGGGGRLDLSASLLALSNGSLSVNGSSAPAGGDGGTIRLAANTTTYPGSSLFLSANGTNTGNGGSVSFLTSSTTPLTLWGAGAILNLQAVSGPNGGNAGSAMVSTQGPLIIDQANIGAGFDPLNTNGAGPKLSFAGSSVVSTNGSALIFDVSGGGFKHTGTGDGGSISVISSGTTALSTGAGAGQFQFTANGGASAGAAGAIELQNGGNLTVNPSDITAHANLAGNGAHITLMAGISGPGILTVTGAAGLSVPPGQSAGQGGTITLQQNSTKPFIVGSTAAVTSSGIAAVHVFGGTLSVTNLGGGLTIHADPNAVSINLSANNGVLKSTVPLVTQAGGSISLSALGKGTMSVGAVEAAKVSLAAGTSAITLNKLSTSDLTVNSLAAVTITNATALAIEESSAGSLILSAPGDIVLHGRIVAPAGKVSINSATYINTDSHSIDVSGTAASPRAGTITLTAPLVSIDALSANGYGWQDSHTGKAGGAGGTITVNSRSGLIGQSASVQAIGGDGDSGVDATVAGGSGGTGGAGGKGGIITFSGSALDLSATEIQAYGGGGGRGGAAMDGSIGAFKQAGGAGGKGGAGGAGGNGGTVTIKGKDSTLHAGDGSVKSASIVTDGGGGGSGANGGAGGISTFGAGGAGGTGGAGGIGGKAGAITISASSTLTMYGGFVTSGGLGGTGGGGGAGADGGTGGAGGKGASGGNAGGTGAIKLTSGDLVFEAGQPTFIRADGTFSYGGNGGAGGAGGGGFTGGGKGGAGGKGGNGAAQGVISINVKGDFNAPMTSSLCAYLADFGGNGGSGGAGGPGGSTHSGSAGGGGQGGAGGAGGSLQAVTITVSHDLNWGQTGKIIAEAGAGGSGGAGGLAGSVSQMAGNAGNGGNAGSGGNGGNTGAITIKVGNNSSFGSEFYLSNHGGQGGDGFGFGAGAGGNAIQGNAGFGGTGAAGGNGGSAGAINLTVGGVLQVGSSSQPWGSTAGAGGSGSAGGDGGQSSAGNGGKGGNGGRGGKGGNTATINISAGSDIALNTDGKSDLTLLQESGRGGDGGNAGNGYFGTGIGPSGSIVAGSGSGGNGGHGGNGGIGGTAGALTLRSTNGSVYMDFAGSTLYSTSLMVKAGDGGGAGGGGAGGVGAAAGGYAFGGNGGNSGTAGSGGRALGLTVSAKGSIVASSFVTAGGKGGNVVATAIDGGSADPSTGKGGNGGSAGSAGAGGAAGPIVLSAQSISLDASVMSGLTGLVKASGGNAGSIQLGQAGGQGGDGATGGQGGRGGYGARGGAGGAVTITNKDTTTLVLPFSIDTSGGTGSSGTQGGAGGDTLLSNGKAGNGANGGSAGGGGSGGAITLKFASLTIAEPANQIFTGGGSGGTGGAGGDGGKNTVGSTGGGNGGNGALGGAGGNGGNIILPNPPNGLLPVVNSPGGEGGHGGGAGAGTQGGESGIDNSGNTGKHGTDGKISSYDEPDSKRKAALASEIDSSFSAVGNITSDEIVIDTGDDDE